MLFCKSPFMDVDWTNLDVANMKYSWEYIKGSVWSNVFWYIKVCIFWKCIQ